MVKKFICKIFGKPEVSLLEIASWSILIFMIITFLGILEVSYYIGCVNNLDVVTTDKDIGILNWATCPVVGFITIIAMRYGFNLFMKLGDIKIKCPKYEENKDKRG